MLCRVPRTGILRSIFLLTSDFLCIGYYTLPQDYPLEIHRLPTGGTSGMQTLLTDTLSGGEISTEEIFNKYGRKKP